MADEEEEKEQGKEEHVDDVEVPSANEAFVSTTTDQAQVSDDVTATAGHVYDGYELLLDADESALDDCLPPATG